MDAEQLTRLGLLESEAKVYLALVGLGQLPAGKIAKETRLNRVSVYKALQTLKEKGLVSYVIKANRQEYCATSPNAVQKMVEEKQKELEEVKKQLPTLQQMFKSTKKKVETNVYEGIKGAKAIWERLLEECGKDDEWLVLGAPKSAELMGGYFKDFNDRRAKKKVVMRIVYNKDAAELIKIRKQQPLTKVRVMPAEYITPTSLEVVRDNALLVIYEPEIVIIHMKSAEVAKSFEAYFNILWKIAEAPK